MHTNFEIQEIRAPLRSIPDVNEANLQNIEAQPVVLKICFNFIFVIKI